MVTPYTHSEGSGPALFLLHGWGMNGDVWEGLLPALTAHYRVTCVDLPGHGRSTLEGRFDLTSLAQSLVRLLPPRASVLGWSLGGMVATQLAVDYPQRVQRLVLVASAPRFVRGEDWPHALAPEVLEGFARELRNDYRNTIKRFLAIQALGSEYARDELRLLRARVFRHGDPHPEALAGGLEILRRADLRARLAEITCPTLLLTGEHDMLFPGAAAAQTRELIAQARRCVIRGAGHAPFLSHPQVFTNALSAFLGNPDQP